MIQTRAQMVNNLPAENAESQRHDSVRVRFYRFLDGSRLIIGDNWVGPILKEGGDFFVENQDILVGPF
jgi:hypothetical protein